MRVASSPWAGMGIGAGAYPEREETRLAWLDRVGSRIGQPLIRLVRKRSTAPRELEARTEAFEREVSDLDADGLRREATAIGVSLRQMGFALEPVARSFALVREAAGRELGMRHYDVQLRCGFALLSGCVAEMQTGEGKTLAATLAAATAALAGLPVHVITVNDYLVSRDAEEMGAVYRALGLSVGTIQQGMPHDRRRAAYACDITYCSNKELAFDYLRDRIALGNRRSRTGLQVERLRDGRSRADRLLLRGLCFGIVDEADSVLIDEAKTPLIVSGGNSLDELEETIYETALELARSLEDTRDFELDTQQRAVQLTERGEARLGALREPLSGIWSGPRRSRELVRQALSALHLFVRDQHYLVADGKVKIVDEYTGRVMADRSWEHGLHQMVEAKEGCELTGRIEPLARISYQRFFRRFMRLSGMTGTAREVAGELFATYGMSTVRIPTHRPVVRIHLGDRVCNTAEQKWRIVLDRIAGLHALRRPVLVGTRSVAASEHLSQLLTDAGIEHRVLNARQDETEAATIAKAGQYGSVTVATNMAGRGTDILLDDDALAAGGLHVIATERHEARRIDRQLFGRAGRQGDPGSCESITSLEDELIVSHSPSDRWPSASVRATKVRMWVAQRSAERLHARMRREVLASDEHFASALAFSGRGE